MGITERKTTPTDITAAAVASFSSCQDSRRRELMQAFVRHLHSYAQEVALTE
jgi:Catechol dioxygenase N terminus